MKRYWKAFTILTFGFLLLFGWDINPWASATVPGVYGLINSDSSGSQGNASGNSPFLSGDGRYVAFSSGATNLVSNDINGYSDVFVKDNQTGVTTLVSEASNGTQGDNTSFDPGISYGGRYVVFTSYADNLVSGTSGPQIFMHDMQTGDTTLVSASSSGTPGNNNSDYPSVSADGRFVVFQSYATNLVSGVSSGTDEIYEKDISTGSIKLLSKNSSGVQADQNSAPPRISCDGGVVAFESPATNLGGYDSSHPHNVYIDVLSGGDNALTNITASANSSADDHIDVSCNGNDVVYASDASNLVSGDSNNTQDVFEYNRLTGDNTIASVESDGTQLSSNSYAEWPVVSDDGRFIAFYTDGSSGYLDSHALTSQGGVYIHDMKEGSTQALFVRSDGVAMGSTTYPEMSADGSLVIVKTDSSLVSGASGTDLVSSKTGY